MIMAAAWFVGLALPDAEYSLAAKNTFSAALIPDLLPAVPATLQNGEDFKNVEEQVEHSDEDGNGQPNSIGHGVGHVFSTLHIVEDIAREDGNAHDRDDECKECALENALEEDAHETGNDEQNQAEKQVITQA